jgi:hypothetical protein
MNCSLRAVQALVLLGFIASGSGIACAAGLVGERFWGFTLDMVDFDNPDLGQGLGITATANWAKAKEFDFTFEYSQVSADSGYFYTNFTGHQILLGARWYSNADPKVKPCATLAIGGAWTKHDDDSVLKIVSDATLGLELTLSEKVSVLPYVGWTCSLESEVKGAASYGMVMRFDFNERWGLLARLADTGKSGLGGSLGVKRSL